MEVLGAIGAATVVASFGVSAAINYLLKFCKLNLGMEICKCCFEDTQFDILFWGKKKILNKKNTKKTKNKKTKQNNNEKLVQRRRSNGLG
jgi:hypothetical protein